jgi:acyl-CoA synthetase (AMP-forming)/AMP-acid ligase II
MNITDSIRQFARTRPDAVAIIRADDTRMSYRMLDGHIDAFARRAWMAGLAPGQIAGLSIGGPDESLALVMALALARIGVASADVRLPSRYLAAVLVQPGVAAPDGQPTVGFDWAWLSEGDPAGCADGGVILRVFGTSGTTGMPRFCAVSHDAMAARIAGKGFPIIDREGPPVLICAMGLGGAAGLRACLTAFNAGGTVVFSNMPRLVNAVLRHSVTSLAVSPRTLQEILATIPAGAGPLPSLRALRISGSHLPAALARKAAERLCANVVTTFGSTETGNVCSGRHGAFGGTPFAVGRILPDMQAEAVDDDHRPLPPGTEGTLRIRGPGMTAGYFGDAAATRAAFRDGWFYPGDRGAVTQERVMIVTGRLGDFINSGGVKVNPKLIEDVLLSLPGIVEAAAFGVPDADGLAQIWAAIVPDGPVDDRTLRTLCAVRLGARAPKFVLQMRGLPRNESGKVVTAALAEYAAGLSGR